MDDDFKVILLNNY